MGQSILTPAQQSGDHAKLAEIVRDFLTELSWCASKFQWFIDKDGYLRGLHDEHYAPFCPIGAVWFCRFRDAVAPSEDRLWDAAELLKLGSAALHLSLAADGDRDYGKLRQKLLEAVGFTSD